MIAEKKLILAQCEAKLILAITANQRDKAVTLLKDNLDESTEFEHVPKEPEYVLQLAEVQLAQRKTAEASASYQEAIALDSSNSYAQQKLAELQLFIDSSSAKATFPQAQALDQSNRHAKLGLIACQLKELGLLLL